MARDERMNPECYTEIELLEFSDHLLRIGKFPAIEFEQTLRKNTLQFLVGWIINPFPYVMRRPIVIDADLRAWKVSSDDFLGELKYFLRVDILLELGPCRPDRFDDHALIGRRRRLANMPIDHGQMKVAHVDVLHEFVLESMGDEGSLTVRRSIFGEELQLFLVHRHEQRRQRIDEQSHTDRRQPVTFAYIAEHIPAA